MRKNMLILFGSPRQNGFTGHLLALFLREWSRMFPDTDMYLFDAYREKVAPCTACGFCKQRAGCSIPDYRAFDSLYRGADIVVVAAPVYGLGFPAPLKAVFDRTQQYYEAYVTRGVRPVFQKPKKAFLLTAAGSDDGRGAVMMEEQLRLMFSVMHTALAGAVRVGNTDNEPPDTAALQAEIRRLLLANTPDL